jgi:hypothetical protein
MSRRKKHRGSRPGPETPPPETPRIEPVQLPLPAEAASRADEPLTDPALAVVGADVLGDSGELVTADLPPAAPPEVLVVAPIPPTAEPAAPLVASAPQAPALEPAAASPPAAAPIAPAASPPSTSTPVVSSAPAVVAVVPVVPSVPAVVPSAPPAARTSAPSTPSARPAVPDPRTDPEPHGTVRSRLMRFSTPPPIARASTTPPPAPRVPKPVRPPPTPIELAPGTEITGDLLRELREQRGITLKEIEDVTRVRAGSLAAVEAERFAELPEVKIYVRGFVQALARTIGVDAELAANGYLLRWERWRERTPAPKRHFIK